jgi:hypothetical protein
LGGLGPYGEVPGGAIVRDSGTFSISKSRRAVNDFRLVDLLRSLAISVDIADGVGNT